MREPSTSLESLASVGPMSDRNVDHEFRHDLTNRHFISKVTTLLFYPWSGTMTIHRGVRISVFLLLAVHTLILKPTDTPQGTHSAPISCAT